VVDVGGLPVEFTRGWTTVDVTVKGTEIKVVNTHLEPQYTAPAFIPANAIQAAQAAELMAILGGEAGPVLLLGDFNSAPGVDNGLPLPTPYEIITGAGFIDAWTLRRGPARPGFTCCQDSGLMNRRSALDQRIDIVWFRSGAGEPHLAWARTAGDRHADKTPSGLWPSDHAGTAARLLLP
jgi:endonuclease/exonuclease/phosphatase family metal-dependent hydrolase